jgi:ribosomal protein L13E
MTRRERLQRKLERRKGWAEGARDKSDAAFATASQRAEAIPFGQPILIGHHSEQRDRRYREKIRAGMDKGVAELKRAEDHESKARGLAIALETSIYDDDPDAVEQLKEKIASLERVCEQSKAVNKLWRKGGAAAVTAEFGLEMGATVERHMAQFRWLKSPFTTTNDRAEIRRCQLRIKLIEARRAREGAAFEAGGILIVRSENGWCRVTFVERPERSVLAALREAGFHWGVGSWQGRTEKLPAEVLALEAAAKAEASPPFVEPSDEVAHG